MSQQTSFAAIQQPFIDPQTGMITRIWIKIIQQWQQQLNAGFDANGNLIGGINAAVVIVGHPGTIGSILQNISGAGVVQALGLVAATDMAQGAVILPAGAVNNTLGSAALEPSTAFDAAGSASDAQGNAEAFATTAANTAQTNAETFASNASNLSSGTVPLARLSGISITITTAALTSGGTQGSMEFTNGVLTAQTQAT